MYKIERVVYMHDTLEPINWWDDHFRSVDRVVLTQQELKIPGLRTFGWHDMKQAVPPLKPHFHENCFEVVFVTNGSISFYVDRRPYTIYGGDAFITFPNEVHSTNGVPMSVGEICWLQLDVSQPENFLFLQPEAAENLIGLLRQLPHHCIRTNSNKARNTLTMLSETLLNTLRQDPYLIASYVVVYLYQLLSYAGVSCARVSFDMARACEYIDSHIQEDISFEQIAAFCHISVSQFKQKFKAQLGVSPRSYINQRKIERIKEELTRQSNLTQIASDYGFCNSAYFSVVFKKITGQTPTEYIASLRG